MKKLLLAGLLLAGLLLAGLSGCSKGSSDPTPVVSTPALTGASWAWTSGATVATPKSGGAVTNQPKTVVPNTVKLTYASDGTYMVVRDKSVTSTGTTQTTTGTYTYSGGVITYVSGGKTSTSRVDVLTASNLTLVSTSEDTNTRYVTTDTWAR
jgi:hypothetical protein